MLTGILYPSDGKARVLGLTPWQQRRKLAFRIASVFGQKSQLWYHLPPQDTFGLLARIYELDMNEYRNRSETGLKLCRLLFKTEEAHRDHKADDAIRQQAQYIG